MRLHRLRRTPSVEEAQEALVEGDAPIAAGTARAALAHREFRIVWTGSFASNIGTWMQNVTLGAYAYELTQSAAFVSVVLFAQLGPLLLLSVVGGALADTFDRRRLLIAAQAEQMSASLILAALTFGAPPSRTALVAAVALVGVGNAINAPAYTAILPALVGRRDLAGAVSLNSTQMNASRVVGPAIGGLLFPTLGPSGVFGINALTYLFVIGALLSVRLPAMAVDTSAPTGWRRLVGGFTVARHDPLVRRCLLTIAGFSFLCLPFIGQLPTLAARNLGIPPRSLAYGLLYASFGFGAVVGAVSIGTFLAHHRLQRLVRRGLVAFAVSLTVFALLRHPAPAYPIAVVVGFFYFGTITSLSTVLQVHLPDAVRGRVMALWIMGFGGTVPLGLLVAGPIAEATSITLVALYGAAAAAGLAVYADLESAAGAERSRAVEATGLPGT